MKCPWCKVEIEERAVGEWRSSYIKRRARAHGIGCPVGVALLKRIEGAKAETRARIAREIEGRGR